MSGRDPNGAPSIDLIGGVFPADLGSVPSTALAESISVDGPRTHHPRPAGSEGEPRPQNQLREIGAVTLPHFLRAAAATRARALDVI